MSRVLMKKKIPNDIKTPRTKQLEIVKATNHQRSLLKAMLQGISLFVCFFLGFGINKIVHFAVRRQIKCFERDCLLVQINHLSKTQVCLNKISAIFFRNLS